MGYYSTVVVALTEDSNKKFQEAIENIANEKLRANTRWFVSEFAKNKKIDGLFVFCWENVKWYDIEQPSSMDWIDEFLSNLSEDEYVFMYAGQGEFDCDDQGNVYLKEDFSIEGNLNCLGRRIKYGQTF
jgi:hypothetical protein